MLTHQKIELPSEESAALIAPTPAAFATTTPQSTATLMPTTTAYLPPLQDMTNYDLIWEGQTKLPIDTKNPMQVVSARAVYTSAGTFQIDIYFNDLPETMELGIANTDNLSHAPGEWYMENGWYVNFDFDGNQETGEMNIMESDRGIEASLVVANETKTRKSIHLGNFTGWDMIGLVTIDSGKNNLLTFREIQDFKFDTQENKLTFLGKIEEINQKTHIKVGYKGWDPETESFLDLELVTIQEDAKFIEVKNEETGDQRYNDSAIFISETIPDNTIFRPSQPFTKTWTVLNKGTLVWNTKYHLAHSGNDRMDGPAYTYLTREVRPGETYQF